MAGGNAAVTLREEGYRGRVTLISRELGVPFGRPPLSKTYLRSEEDLDGWYVRPASWHAEQDMDRLVESIVAAVDTASHPGVLHSGHDLEDQQLLLATGGRRSTLAMLVAALPVLH